MATMGQTPVVEMKCCFKNCCERENGNLLGSDCSRVEVKAFEPKKRKDWHVNWAPDGSAAFHKQCWYSLVHSAKDSSKTSFVLSDIERSMILEAKKTAEFHDSESVLNADAKRIAELLQSCKYCIAFTGAGISTAAGIGDFRGKDGKWTEREKAKNFGTKNAKKDRSLVMEQLRPTYTHEALCKLADVGILKFVISQNVDSIHRLSGIPEEKLAELHGNCFMEKCEDCDTRYELKHHYRRAAAGSFPSKKCNRCNISHRTGRKCTKENCNGYLMNTVINFGDYLESDVLSTAEHHAKMADCVLILGSSLKVSPANELVMMGKKPIKLILCNRQTTPYDDHCQEGTSGCRVFGDCDNVMQNVMQQLLSPDALQEWEAAKDTRALQYDMQRCV